MTETAHNDPARAGAPFPTRSVIHLPLDASPTNQVDVKDWISERAHTLIGRGDIATIRSLERVDTQTAVGVGEDHLVLFELSQPTESDPADWITNAGFGADQSVVHGRLARYDELAPGPESTGAAILYVHVDVDEHHLETFLDWYVQCHVPAVVAAPGMIGARRLVETAPRAPSSPGSPGRRHFCTVYEMDRPTVPDQPETLEAGRIGACPPHLQPHRVARNNVYEEVLVVRSV